MDFLNDKSGRHILRLDNLVTVPDYVKSCSVDEEVVAAIPTRLFADQVHREFPIDDSGHVYLSMAYCKSAGINDPELLRVLNAAGEVYGIEKDLEALVNAFDAQEKKASADQQKFAVYVDFGPGGEGENEFVKRGGVQGFYPIATADQLEASAVSLANDKHRVPLPLFVTGCREIIKSASKLGVPMNLIPPGIQTYGIEREADLDFVKAQCALRAQITGDETYNEFAKVAAANVENRPMDDYAELLFDMDGGHDLKYARTHMDPFLMFNTGEVKAAQQHDHENWILINGAAVPKQAFAELPEAEIRKRFVKVHADTVVHLVKSAATMEAPDVTNAVEQWEKGTQIEVLKLLIR